jgi:hypothetical protein
MGMVVVVAAVVVAAEEALATKQATLGAVVAGAVAE